jgi:gamma-glutamyltranspeptidase
MIYFFILLIFIILLLYSEYIVKINPNNPIEKNKPNNPNNHIEKFTDFKSIINMGRCSMSLTQTMNKFNGAKVIDPFNNSNKSFNWNNYIGNARYKVAPHNSVYY